MAWAPLVSLAATLLAVQLRTVDATLLNDVTNHALHATEQGRKLQTWGEWSDCSKDYCCPKGLQCYRWYGGWNNGFENKVFQCTTRQGCYEAKKGSDKWECDKTYPCKQGGGSSGGGGGSGSWPTQEFKSCRNTGYCCGNGLKCYKFQNPRDGGVDYQCMKSQSCWSSGPGWQCRNPLRCNRGEMAQGEEENAHKHGGYSGHGDGSLGEWARCGWDADHKKQLGCCKKGLICAKQKNNNGRYSQCQPKKQCQKHNFFCDKDYCKAGKSDIVSRDAELQDAPVHAHNHGVGSLGEWARCGYDADHKKQLGCCKKGLICAKQKNNNGRYSQCQPKNQCQKHKFFCDKNNCK